MELVNSGNPVEDSRPPAKRADRLRMATVWLGGCSGCHMSFLDLDEWLFDLAAQVDIDLPAPGRTTGRPADRAP